jgi:hypothetical protein
MSAQLPCDDCGYCLDGRDHPDRIRVIYSTGGPIIDRSVVMYVAPASLDPAHVRRTERPVEDRRAARGDCPSHPHALHPDTRENPEPPEAHSARRCHRRRRTRLRSPRPRQLPVIRPSAEGAASLVAARGHQLEVLTEGFNEARETPSKRSKPPQRQPVPRWPRPRHSCRGWRPAGRRRPDRPRRGRSRGASGVHDHRIPGRVSRSHLPARGGRQPSPRRPGSGRHRPGCGGQSASTMGNPVKAGGTFRLSASGSHAAISALTQPQ